MMKASELDKGLKVVNPSSDGEESSYYYIPPQQIPVVKAYEKVGQVYERTVHDRVWDWWITLVTAGPVSDQLIKMVIPQIYRTKEPATGNEFLFYNVDMSGNDWKNNRKDYNYVDGVVEGIPVFNYEIEPSTNAIVPGTTQVLEVKKEYTIPFTKAAVEKISPYFRNPLSCIVIAADGRRYSVSLEQFKNMSYNELVDMATGYSDFMRQRRGQKVYS
jgi:hypothetical protein